MTTADAALRRTVFWADAVRRAFELALCLLPALAIAYLQCFQDPALRFEDHAFHQAAIALATLEGAFISYVAWRCYLRSGQALLRWVTLGFTGFTVVYSLHGFFTPLAQHNLWLFILYGPASRLVLSACLLTALLRFHAAPDAPAWRTAGPWLRWLGLFLALNVAVGVVAHSPVAGAPWLRMSMEIGSIALYVAALALHLGRRLRSPLMQYAALAFVWFGSSSLGFLLARPWNHQWWLAHGLFAVGFSVLGYGILRVFLAAPAHGQGFSVQELSEDLAQTNARLREAHDRLEQVNREQQAQMRALEVAKAQFEAFFNLSPDGIFVVDHQGRVLKANQRAEVMFGYGPGDLAGLQVEALMPDNLREHHVRARSLHQAAPQTRPMGTEERALSCLRRNGEVFSATISLSSLIYEGRPCTVTFVRDVSRLLRKVEQIRQEDRASIRQGHILEQLSAQLPFVVFQFRRGPQGRYDFPYMSPKVAELLGCGAEALRANINLWFSTVDPAGLASLISSIERSAAERSPWTARWQARLPGAVEAMPCLLRCSAPVPQPDGSLVWTGYMRRAHERDEDAAADHLAAAPIG
ncbi:PAS domain S-box protein [Azohydromonas caseinilytica]|uniref:PAS domain S-box protein n=1 Tax=Azohydromonas caseinilytica TaxID=2728836 RepID=A0A848FK18_9BURK|nr:PAS domain S-box protein [Azohydromonas caseinilytica]NML18679.1 PAS domain S-box protein [Azohydromonas caseinilytica]